MNKLAVVFLTLLAAGPAMADAAAGGSDYSGIYDCTGNDAHEGTYTGIVTMRKDVAHSTAEFGAYKFSLEVPGFGTYKGMAVAQGEKLAIYFSLPGQANGDYGVGMATLGNKGFSKFYYEPEYKGGNTGTEECVLRQ